LLVLGPSRGATTAVTIATDRIRPSWFPVTWGTEFVAQHEGWEIRPQAPGRPWVGFRLQRRRAEIERDPLRPVLDRSWRSRGVLRFSIKGGRDRNGVLHPPPPLQLFLFATRTGRTGHAVRVRPWHSASGRWDREPGAWKTAIVPLRLFEVPETTKLFAIAFQVVGGLDHAFSVKNVSLECWTEERLDPFLGPEPGAASFPALVELPAALRAPAGISPAVRGSAVLLDGRRRFLLGAQLNYDMRLDLWGYSVRPPSESGATWAGYPPELAWIYETIPNRAQLTRVGFNAWSVFAPPEPFLRAYVPLPLPKRELFEPERLKALAAGIGLPAIVDLSAFPWTIGQIRSSGDLPPGALAPNRPREPHFMPLSLMPAGRRLYLEYFERVARFLKDVPVPAFQFELFNEPDYPAGSALHREDFARFLRENFPDEDTFLRRCPRARAEPNAAGDIYTRAAALPPDHNLFLRHAHGRYLSELFTRLVADGMETVRRAYGRPDVLFSVQVNRWHAVEGSPLLDPEALCRMLPIVAAPTDGGIWTFGSGADARPAHVIDSPLAPAPITADLLCSLAAGAKPIFDQEMSAPGSAEALRAALWTRVLVGFDGVWLFSWSKQAWRWNTAEEGKRVVASAPHLLLNPYAHPPSELAAVAAFRRELAPHEELLLPKPFGVAPQVAFLHGFANEAAHSVIPTDRDLGRTTYAALRYSHVPFAVVTERQLRSDTARPRKALVVSGLTVLERETIPCLRSFVEGGGTLLLVNAPLALDQFGEPLGADWLTDAVSAEPDRHRVTIDGLAGAGLPGTVEGVGFRRIACPGDEAFLRATDGSVRVMKRPLSAGRVYVVCFEAKGYALLRVLLAILRREGIEAPWRLAFADSGDHAVNCLVSVRDRGPRKVVMLANQDLYEKRLRFSWPGLRGTWQARIDLGAGGETGRLTSDGIAFDLPPEDVRLIILSRERGGTEP
jgi:hypothetical protein